MAKAERNSNFGKSVDALMVLQYQPLLGQYKDKSFLSDKIQ